MTPDEFQDKVNKVMQGRRNSREDRGDAEFPQEVKDLIAQLGSGTQDLQSLLDLTQPPPPVCCLYTVNGIVHCVCGVSPGECATLNGTVVTSCGNLRPYNI
jgi:hypothetical protein